MTAVVIVSGPLMDDELLRRHTVAALNAGNQVALVTLHRAPPRP